MRMRALLALLVLLGTLPFQCGVQATGGRADSGGIGLHLEANGAGPHALGLTAPVVNDSVVLGRNGSADFTIANFSALGLSMVGPEFHLDLSLVSLNFSGMRISCSLFLDPRGNGSAFQVLFDNYTSAVAVQTEHASLAAFALDVEPAGLDFLNGTMRLQIARTDEEDGLLEVLCGNGENASLLSVPYGPPLIADAGPDVAARTNATVSLNASASRSVDLANTTCFWDLGNGANRTGITATAVYNRSGEYTVTLTLSYKGFMASDALTVNVSDNIPPVSYAGSKVTKRINEPFTFRGIGTDADGRIVAYSWDFGDNFTAAGQNATHAFASSGDYAVVLTVQDNDGAEGTDTINVHILRSPEVTNITAGKVGHTVNFQISVSDTEGTQLTYSWDFGDGSNGSGSMTGHTYNRTGSFVATCLVLDPYGDNATASVNITLENSPPRILTTQVGGSTTGIFAGQPVHFSAGAMDPDGDAITYLWDFGDGNHSNVKNSVHSYEKAGKYTWTLRVSDGIADSVTSDVVEVQDASNPLDSATISLAVCAIIFVVIIIIVLARLMMRRPAPAPPPYGPYGGMPPNQHPPPTVPPAPPPYGAPFGYPYGAPTGGMTPPSPPRPPRVRAAPGICPRCGSTDVRLFPDGHSKCVSCRKIFFTG